MILLMCHCQQHFVFIQTRLAFETDKKSAILSRQILLHQILAQISITLYSLIRAIEYTLYKLFPDKNTIISVYFQNPAMKMKT